MSATAVQDVLHYWFGPGEAPDEEHRKRWFQGGDDIDQDIKTRFAGLHQQLQTSLPDDWPTDAEGLLAAILVIDQFSRNLYRRQAQAFAWDNLARDWSLQGWQRGLFDTRLPHEQGFALLPLVHSEDLQDHDTALAIFERLKDQGPETDTIITAFYSSALEHRAIIAEFGRYPHRNAVLNRPSTDAEHQYLAGKAKRFGQ